MYDSEKDSFNRYLERCMTVGELKDALSGFADDAKVVVARTAPDYWRSPIAERIDGVDQIAVGWTEYHRCLKNLSEQDDDEGGGTDTVVAIFI